MRKCSIIYFLLPALLIIALNSEGKSTGNIKLDKNFHHSAVYPHPAANQLPASISPFHCCVSVAPNGITFQHCIHSNGIKNALLRLPILLLAGSIKADGFPQQDQYLSDIYPSHNFW